MRACAVLLGLLGFAIPVMAQAPPAESFEVAAIRANHSGDRVMLFQPSHGGRFTATNCSLRLLIQYAYDVYQFQIYGGPVWIQSARYDIAAKAGGDPSVSIIRAMLRHLLEDRFQLQAHWDTAESGVFNLVVSKAGKLRESAPGDCPPPLPNPQSRPGQPPEAPCGALRNSPGDTAGRKLTAAELANSLAMFVGRPVLDKTGLKGKYDIDLRWTPDAAGKPSPAVGPLEPIDTTGPSIFTALQEQLGLKLESAIGQAKVLVIDHAARPSEN